MGDQPLSDDSVLLGSLGRACGGMLSSSTEGPGATRFEMDSCDVVIDVDRGVLHVDTLVERSWSNSRLSSEDVTTRQAEDVALLTALGFDADEFGVVATKEFAARDLDEETGSVSSPRYLGTKTVVDRTVSGVPVQASRVVVTRDASGALSRLTAAWPALDSVMVVAVSDTSDLTEDEATDFTERPVLAVQAVMILADPVDGVVGQAIVCTEVTRLVNGPDGFTKPSAFYVMDGVIIDPREAR